MISASAIRYSLPPGISLLKLDPLASEKQKVKPAIFETLVLHDFADAADVHDRNRLEPWRARRHRTDLDHRHQTVARQRVFGHLAITRLKNVKRQGARAGKAGRPAMGIAGTGVEKSGNSEVKSIVPSDDTAGFDRCLSVEALMRRIALLSRASCTAVVDSNPVTQASRLSKLPRLETLYFRLRHRQGGPVRSAASFS